MKGLFASLAMLCALCVALPAAQAKPLPGPKTPNTLKGAIPVAGPRAWPATANSSM